MELVYVGEYDLRINHQELLLISKALGGRLSTPQEKTDAIVLDRNIALQRIKIAEHSHNETQKLKKNLEEK